MARAAGYFKIQGEGGAGQLPLATAIYLTDGGAEGRVSGYMNTTAPRSRASRKVRARAMALIVCTVSASQVGCENMSATENGLIAAGLVGAATGIALGTTGVPAGSTIPISIGAGVGAGAIAAGVANYQTSRERRIFTEQQGRDIVARARGRGRSNIPRYILVDTITTSPKPGRPVMVFDTQTGVVAGNRVYYSHQIPDRDGIIASPYGGGDSGGRE
jgi:hypothetical protein